MLWQLYVAREQSKEWQNNIYNVPLLKRTGKVVKVQAMVMEVITED